MFLNFGSHKGRTLEQSFARFISNDIDTGQIDPNHVVITSGAQHGVMVALLSIKQREQPVVAVDDLAFGGFRDLSDMLGCDIYSIAWDEDGPLPWSLEHCHQKYGVNVYITSAEVHNPTMACVTNERRVELADVAKRCGINIIDDDCCRISVASGPSYRALAPQMTWYVTSLSKVLSTGLRLGAVIAPELCVHTARKVVMTSILRVSDYFYHLGQHILTSDALAGVRSRIGDETETYLEEAINRLGRFELSWQPKAPFLFIWLPRGWRTTAFCQEAERRGVLVVPSDAFVLRNAKAPAAVRICVNAEYGLHAFTDAIDTLADILQNPSQEVGIS